MVQSLLNKVDGYISSGVLAVMCSACIWYFCFSISPGAKYTIRCLATVGLPVNCAYTILSLNF